jgi:hypothetical protein
MEVSSLRILFKENGKPIESRVITTCISDFGNSYNETVREIIVKSGKGVDREIFHQNVARLMPNFKMTRRRSKRTNCSLLGGYRR